MKTINADDQAEESKRTVEQKNDSDLHEFCYEGRKFYVRLNQFNGHRIIQGYLKKLCKEGSFLFSASFEMRFCIMDMHEMVFKYAKSPKEEFSIIDMEELVSCNFEDPRRQKPIKVKKGKQNDLKYLLYLIGRKRTYVLSSHTRSDQVMWFNGFQVFFKVKHVINLVKNGAAFSKQSLQMLEEARQKKALRSKQSIEEEGKSGADAKKSRDAASKAKLPEKGATSNVGLKGKLGAKEDKNKANEKSKRGSVAEASKAGSKWSEQKNTLLTGENILCVAGKNDKKGSLNQNDRKKPNRNNQPDIFGRSNTLTIDNDQARADKQAEGNKTRETERGESINDGPEEKKSQQIEKAQRLIQANFLKAVMIDDPALREFAIARLQNIQTKVNKGEGVDKIESLMADLPWNPETPNAQQSLDEVKKEAHAKQEMNKTQIELAEVAEQRKQQEEEMQQAKLQIEQIKRQKTIAASSQPNHLASAQPFAAPSQPIAIVNTQIKAAAAQPVNAMNTESEYEYEEYYGTEYSESEIQVVHEPTQKEISEVQPNVKLAVSPQKHLVKAASPEIKKVILEPKLKAKTGVSMPMQETNSTVSIKFENQPPKQASIQMSRVGSIEKIEQKPFSEIVTKCAPQTTNNQAPSTQVEPPIKEPQPRKSIQAEPTVINIPMKPQPQNLNEARAQSSGQSYQSLQPNQQLPPKVLSHNENNFQSHNQQYRQQLSIQRQQQPHSNNVMRQPSPEPSVMQGPTQYQLPNQAQQQAQPSPTKLLYPRQDSRQPFSLALSKSQYQAPHQQHYQQYQQQPNDPNKIYYPRQDSISAQPNSFQNQNSFNPPSLDAPQHSHQPSLDPLMPFGVQSHTGRLVSGPQAQHAPLQLKPASEMANSIQLAPAGGSYSELNSMQARGMPSQMPRAAVAVINYDDQRSTNSMQNLHAAQSNRLAGNSINEYQYQETVARPAPPTKVEVADMLQSLQTIQADNDDDFKEPQLEQPNQSRPQYEANVQSLTHNQPIQGFQSITVQEDPAVINNLEGDFNAVSRNNENQKSRNSNVGSQFSFESNNYNDNLTDSMPNFVIKPFEKSLENVEADAQTAIKGFNDRDTIQSVENGNMPQEVNRHIADEYEVSRAGLQPTHLQKAELHQKPAQPIYFDASKQNPMLQAQQISVQAQNPQPQQISQPNVMNYQARYEQVHQQQPMDANQRKQIGQLEVQHVPQQASQQHGYQSDPRQKNFKQITAKTVADPSSQANKNTVLSQQPHQDRVRSQQPQTAYSTAPAANQNAQRATTAEKNRQNQHSNAPSHQKRRCDDSDEQSIEAIGALEPAAGPRYAGLSQHQQQYQQMHQQQARQQPANEAESDSISRNKLQFNHIAAPEQPPNSLKQPQVSQMQESRSVQQPVDQQRLTQTQPQIKPQPQPQDEVQPVSQHQPQAQHKTQQQLPDEQQTHQQPQSLAQARDSNQHHAQLDTKARTQTASQPQVQPQLQPSHVSQSRAQQQPQARQQQSNPPAQAALLAPQKQAHAEVNAPSDIQTALKASPQTGAISQQAKSQIFTNVAEQQQEQQPSYEKPIQSQPSHTIAEKELPPQTTQSLVNKLEIEKEQQLERFSEAQSSVMQPVQKSSQQTSAVKSKYESQGWQQTKEVSIVQSQSNSPDVVKSANIPKAALQGDDEITKETQFNQESKHKTRQSSQKKEELELQKSPYEQNFSAQNNEQNYSSHQVNSTAQKEPLQEGSQMAENSEELNRALHMSKKVRKNGGGKLEIHNMIATHQGRNESESQTASKQRQLIMPEAQKQQRPSSKNQHIKADPSPKQERTSILSEEDKIKQDIQQKEPAQIAEYMNGGLSNDYQSQTSQQAFSLPKYVISKPDRNSSRNQESGIFHINNASGNAASSSDREMSQSQVKKKRRLHITRASNPQENSVLDPRNTSQATHLQNTSALNDSTSQEPFKVEISQEYLNARKFFMKSQIGSQLNDSALRSSQRILKVVNIIGSSNENKEGQLSSKRVSSIRARQYKSKGEKVTFRHTGSRENLMSSQELVRASGFTQVKLNPVDFADYPDETSSGGANIGRQYLLTNMDHNSMTSQQARKNLKLLSKQKGATQKPNGPSQSVNFYPSNDSRNLNRLLDEMENQDRSDQKSQQPDLANIGSPTGGGTSILSPVISKPVQGVGLQEPGSFSLWPRDNEIPAETSPILVQRQQSLNKTNDIFKRTNQSFDTSQPISPSNLDSHNNSLAHQNQNFEELVNQQRDSYVLEKMQQQHRVQMHRKNSASRQSIESQKRTERDEKIKINRARRKQLALQNQAERTGAAQFEEFKRGSIPIPTTGFLNGRASAVHAMHQQPRRTQNLEKSDLAAVQGHSSVGLSDMFYSQRPSTQQAFTANSSHNTQPVFDFHRVSHQQQPRQQTAPPADEKKDDDADSHFSEEW